MLSEKQKTRCCCQQKAANRGLKKIVFFYFLGNRWWLYLVTQLFRVLLWQVCISWDPVGSFNRRWIKQTQENLRLEGEVCGSVDKKWRIAPSECNSAAVNLFLPLLLGWWESDSLTFGTLALAIHLRQIYGCNFFIPFFFGKTPSRLDASVRLIFQPVAFFSSRFSCLNCFVSSSHRHLKTTLNPSLVPPSAPGGKFRSSRNKRLLFRESRLPRPTTTTGDSAGRQIKAASSFHNVWANFLKRARCLHSTQ